MKLDAKKTMKLMMNHIRDETFWKDALSKITTKKVRYNILLFTYAISMYINRTIHQFIWH